MSEINTIQILETTKIKENTKTNKLPEYILNSSRRYRERNKDTIIQKHKSQKLEKDKLAITTIPNNELTKPQLLLKVELLEAKLKEHNINIL
jgi:hypothetical protein